MNAVTGTRSTGYLLKWEDICMHAVCSDVGVLSMPHIYCMASRELEEEVAEINMNLETNENTNDIRFAPITPSSELLQQLFDLFGKAVDMIDDEGDFQGSFICNGDFNSEKRKLSERESEDDVFTSIDPEMLKKLLPDGTDLPLEEVERRLAEWDSKLVIEGDEEQQGGGINECLAGNKYHPYSHNRVRGQGNRGENSGHR